MSRRVKKSPFSFSATHAVFLFGLTTFFMGIIAAIMITRVLAQTADTNQIYACVNNVNGGMRMVTSEEPCKNNEKSVKWSIQGPPGPPGPAGDTGGLNQYFGLPFICTGCYFRGLGDRFAEKDFSYAQIQRSDFSGEDLHGVNFKNGFLKNNNFNNTNLEDSNFSEMSEIEGAGYPANNNFKNSNLTNSDFSNSILHEFDFTDANVANVNFSGALLRNTIFINAQNLSSANFENAIWENTKCPDGTNSNTNGGTCEGHF